MFTDAPFRRPPRHMIVTEEGVVPLTNASDDSDYLGEEDCDERGDAEFLRDFITDHRDVEVSLTIHEVNRLNAIAARLEHSASDFRGEGHEVS